VHHRRRQEAQSPASEVDDVVGSDGVDRQTAVVFGDALHACRRGDDPRVGHGGHDRRQPAVVVGLHVVDDDETDLCRVDDVGDAREQLVDERGLHGVDERYGIGALDEVGVVGRATRRLVAVEVAQVPVNGADPVDGV
jgi:hypothetical protein